MNNSILKFSPPRQNPALAGQNSKLQKIMVLFLVLGFWLLSALAAFAQTTPPLTNSCDQNPEKCKLGDPLGATSVTQLIGRFIASIIPFLGAAAVIMFVVGSIHWILSSGNPDKVKKGQDTLVWAVLGSAVAIGAYVALKFIMDALTGNLNFFK